MTAIHPLWVAYTQDYQRWQLGAGHPTNPVRAKLAVDLLERLLPGRHERRVYVPTPAPESQLRLVHQQGYLDQLRLGISTEWDGAQPELYDVARRMVGGSTGLYARILGGGVRLGFNPQGAKHHAMPGHGEGFCVLNDHAVVAELAMRDGMRVAVLDWDAHHGNGTEDCLRGAGTEAVTISIHQEGIYPGTGNTSTVADGVVNMPLRAGSGDAAMLRCVQDGLDLLSDHKPDLLLVAAGADGLQEDPLTGLAYTLPGIYQAATMVGAWAGTREVPVLVGGAGGYTPYKETPMAWAGAMVSLRRAYNKVSRG